MKVIGAGFPKTGTKSLWHAMEILGFNHLESPNWVDHLLDDWVSFMRGDSDFDSICKKVEKMGGESCSDLPWNLYWEEFFNKYPDSKVILTVRDSDEVWYRSFRNYLESMQSTGILAGSDVQYYEQDPQYAKWMWILKDHWRSMFGTPANPFMLDGLTKKENDLYLNENQLRQRYRMHNAYVMATVPKERLLVYNLKEGWEPLCQFLGKDIPDIPVPHDNKYQHQESNNKAVHCFMKTNLVKNRDATVQRLKQEKLNKEA